MSEPQQTDMEQVHRGEALFVRAWDRWSPAETYFAPAPAVIDAEPSLDADLFINAWDTCLGVELEASTADPEAEPGVTPLRRTRRLLRELVQTAAVAAVVFAITQTAVQGREVEGPSMEPSYHTHQKVLVNRIIFARPGWTRAFGWLPLPSLSQGDSFAFRRPLSGEVIVFNPPFASRADLIKRVVGTPGERVTITAGKVFINGALIAESYVQGFDSSAATSCTGRWCDYTLKADEFYVMGDNRGNSQDSRAWGPVHVDQIVGKAWFVYRPFSDFGPAP